MPVKGPRKLRLAPRKKFSVKQFCRRLQIHGVLDLYEAETVAARIFWSTMIVLFFAAFSFGLYESYMEFYTNPITTTLSLQFNRSMAFPEVYVCPANFISSSRQNDSSRLKIIMRAYFPQLLKTPSFSGLHSGVPHARRAWRKVRFSGAASSLMSIKRSLLASAIRVDELFRECRFEAKSLVCADVIEQVIDREYGVCYLVSVNHTQRVAGYGLRLLLYLQPKSYPNFDGRSMLFEGAHVRIQKKIDPASFTGVFISPGHHSRIDIEGSYARLINVGYSRTPQMCYESKQHELKIFDYGYTRSLCLADCVQAWADKNCHCLRLVDPRYLAPRFAFKQPCCASTFDACVENQSLSDTDSVGNCSEFCHESCVHWSYQASVSSIAFPSEALIKAHHDKAARYTDDGGNDTGSPATWVNRYAVLEIAHGRLQFWVTTQSESMSLTNLVSAVGGLCGLWLGASMLSLVQLVSAFIYYGYSKIAPSFNKDPRKFLKKNNLDYF